LKKNPKNKSGTSERGVTLLEAMIGLGIGGAVLLGVLNFFDMVSGLQNLAFTSRSQTVEYSLFTNLLRSTFYRRSQIDLQYGVGIYDSVETAIGSEYALKIRSRNKTNLAIQEHKFETVCLAGVSATSLKIPPVDGTLMPNLPACDLSTGRYAVKVTTEGVSRVVYFGTDKSQVVSSVFYVRSASNENVSVLLAQAVKRDKRMSHWVVQELELWDDIPRQGLEFLK